MVFLCFQNYVKIERCLKVVNNYRMLGSSLNKIEISISVWYDPCISMIFTIHQTIIFNFRKYWEIFWNLQLCNHLCFFFVFVVYLTLSFVFCRNLDKKTEYRYLYWISVNTCWKRLNNYWGRIGNHWKYIFEFF